MWRTKSMSFFARSIMVGNKKGRSTCEPARRVESVDGLDVGLGLAETLDAVARLPLAALLQERHALEALQDVTFLDDTAAGGFETGMLGHKRWLV
jgi:hypothetical protein